MNDPDASMEKGAVPPVPAPEHPYAVLRNRNFLLYLIGRFVASIGQQMLTVAVGWELYERTHSALNLGLVGLTNMVPMFLFTLPAGHLADSLNRKRIILAMLALSALASAGLGVASALHAPVAWTYAALFLAATARTFMWPASAAFLPQLVTRRDFARAVTWSRGASSFHASPGPRRGAHSSRSRDMPRRCMR